MRRRYENALPLWLFAMGMMIMSVVTMRVMVMLVLSLVMRRMIHLRGAPHVTIYPPTENRHVQSGDRPGHIHHFHVLGPVTNIDSDSATRHDA